MQRIPRTYDAFKEALAVWFRGKWPGHDKMWLPTDRGIICISCSEKEADRLVAWFSVTGRLERLMRAWNVFHVEFHRGADVTFLCRKATISIDITSPDAAGLQRVNDSVKLNASVLLGQPVVQVVADRVHASVRPASVRPAAVRPASVRPTRITSFSMPLPADIDSAMQSQLSSQEWWAGITGGMDVRVVVQVSGDASVQFHVSGNGQDQATRLIREVFEYNVSKVQNGNDLPALPEDDGDSDIEVDEASARPAASPPPPPIPRVAPAAADKTLSTVTLRVHNNFDARGLEKLFSNKDRVRQALQDKIKNEPGHRGTVLDVSYSPGNKQVTMSIRTTSDARPQDAGIWRQQLALLLRKLLSGGAPQKPPSSERPPAPSPIKLSQKPPSRRMERVSARPPAPSPIKLSQKPPSRRVERVSARSPAPSPIKLSQKSAERVSARPPTPSPLLINVPTLTMSPTLMMSNSRTATS
jgi:hypothetical protein